MINWKLRMKNKTFWIALIPALLLVVQVFSAMFGFDLSIDVIGDKLLACVNAVFALLTVLGLVVDPTTAGLSDSERAMLYDEPHRDTEG